MSANLLSLEPAALPRNPISPPSRRASRALVVGRLRGGRHDTTDRRRAAVRSARSASRKQGARCRGRQRQRDAGGGAPVVRGDLDRLRAGAARTRPRARHGRRAGDRFPRGGRRGIAVSRTRASTWWSRPSVSCSHPTRTRRRPRCSGSASPAARLGWPTGRRTASSASCSRRSANTCRHRPA